MRTFWQPFEPLLTESWQHMVNHLTGVYRPLISLCQRLKGLNVPWLVGGSTGCLLQKVCLEKKPNDLDIYTDYEYVDPLQQALNDWNVKPAHYSETERYGSYLSRYRIHSFTVELVGDLSVRTASGRYDVDVSGLLVEFAPAINVQAEIVKVMPLEHEFVFNLLRNREDRYKPIAEVIKQRGVEQLLWRQLKEQNTLSDDFWNRASALIGNFHSEQDSQPCGAYGHLFSE